MGSTFDPFAFTAFTEQCPTSELILPEGENAPVDDDILKGDPVELPLPDDDVNSSDDGSGGGVVATPSMPASMRPAEDFIRQEGKMFYCKWPGCCFSYPTKKSQVIRHVGAHQRGSKMKPSLRKY